MPAIPLAEEFYSDPSREMRAAVSTAVEDATKASTINSRRGDLDDSDEEVYSRLIFIAMLYFGVSFLPLCSCCRGVYKCRVSLRGGMRREYEMKQKCARWPSVQEGSRPVSLIFTLHFGAFIIADWSNTNARAKNCTVVPIWSVPACFLNGSRTSAWFVRTWGVRRCSICPLSKTTRTSKT